MRWYFAGVAARRIVVYRLARQHVVTFWQMTMQQMTLWQMTMRRHVLPSAIFDNLSYRRQTATPDHLRQARAGLQPAQPDAHHG